MAPNETLREARTAYFAANGFGADGGYSARWVQVKVGPIPFVFPNSAERVRAVRYHDLHHVVTGYTTDFVGEAEIGAWEVASGCRSFVAAWVLNLGAMAVGNLFDRHRVFAAFVRGRHTQNLYGERFEDALLDRTVEATRRELGLEQPTPAPTMKDRIAFAAWLALWGVGLLAMLAVPLLVLLWWLAR
jgi:hypothetical protein